MESLPKSRIERSNLATLEPHEGGLMAEVQTLEAVKVVVANEFDKIIALLKRKQNANLPIFRLPIELLTTIFQKALPPYEEDPRMMQYTPSLMRLASVCHWWRRIILDAPALWTIVSVANRFHPFQVGEALNLSRQMPLDVVYAPRENYQLKPDNVLLMLYRESFRWRRLGINYDGLLHHLEFLETVSAPGLEDFYLCLNTAIEDGNATFRVAGAAIYWELGQLAGGRLRHLELHVIRTHAPSVAQILDIVHLSPLLEALSLNQVALVTSNHPDLPTLRPPSLRTVCLTDLPSTAIRQLVPCIEPTSRCINFTVENTPTMQEAPDFFAPGYESVLASILRSRNGNRIYLYYEEGACIEVSNGGLSYLRVNGDAADRGLEWVHDCLASPTETTSGEVHLETSHLMNFLPDAVPQHLVTMFLLPKVVELTLNHEDDDWESKDTLLKLLSWPLRNFTSGEEYWGLPQLQFVTLEGTTPSIIPIFIQMVRARLGLEFQFENACSSQNLHRPYPLPLKEVHMHPAADILESLSRSELDKLQDIIEEGGGNVYWRSKLWKDWPKDLPHDQADLVPDSPSSHG
ncbi:hypothetical protein M407DRAFT_10236 [Tulasnella calospora MUT 4182]|uniref:F-box domain-containing protein n=1 Tax=Tulasnella calospora MUT 4182 TaxID=1051891 RepID=A0A0C3QAA3_9AGAM|nr:hypothetical protein M407DRAFT_10236 [Tulasnella calospora MUT 4182]